VLKIFDSTLKRVFSALENTKDTFVKEIYKKLKTSFDSRVKTLKTYPQQLIPKDQIFSLYYPLERSIIEWESNSQKCSDLVRLGFFFLLK
jgi:hypothetical protein